MRVVGANRAGDERPRVASAPTVLPRVARSATKDRAGQAPGSGWRKRVYVDHGELERLAVILHK